MSEGLAAVLLFAAFLGWMLLPLLPALRELLRPTDATPLAMVGQDSGELTYFADRFRTYLDEQLPSAAPGAPLASGRLVDGTRWVRRSSAAGEPAPAAGARTDAVVLAEPGTQLPPDGVYTMEIHARGDLTCGARTVVRAVLADGSCALGDGSDVLRWVHADGALRVGAHATLHGRATSGEAIELQPGVRFARLHAPRIGTRGSPDAEPFLPSVPSSVTPLTPFSPPGATALGDGYLRVDGSLVVPPRSEVGAHLVVRGDLHVGEGSRLAGAVKAHGSVTLDRDVTVTGAVVARRHIHVGAGTQLAGAVIAEESVVLGARVRVGRPGHPATVSAPRVRLAAHVAVHGAINTADGAVDGVAETSAA